MKRNKYFVLVVAGIIGLSCFFSNAGYGQEFKYPTKPIQVIIPYAPGGTFDINGRIVDGQLQEILKVPIIHINKPGGNGVLGATYVKEQPADGYTILYGGSTPVVELPVITPNCSYNWQDFIPIARVTYGPLILGVKNGGPYNNVKDLVKAAQNEPGKISVGIPGIGVPQHIVAKFFEHEAKIKLNIIPFKGDSPSITALLGGHLDAIVAGITSITPHIKSETVKAIASSSGEPHPVFKDIPLFKDIGYPEVVMISWTGPFIHAKTPEPIIKILNDAYRLAATHPSVIALFEKGGTTPGYLSSEEVKKRLPLDYETYVKAAKLAGLVK